MLITFSGLDGAGKSTLISYVEELLVELEVKSTVLTMYDHVGLYATIRRLRDTISAATDTASDDGLPAENRRSRHRRGIGHGIVAVVRSRLAKQFVYVIDLLCFLLFRFYTEVVRRRVLILDRYFYDSLADIAKGPLSWIYIRGFLWFTPRPQLALFIDVPAEIAFARKGEYTVEYLRKRRDTYVKIFLLDRGQVVMLENDDIDTTRARLRELILDRATH